MEPTPEPADETFTIETSLPQERLDAFLKTRYPDQSRGKLQRLIEEGHILLNGEPTRSTHHPRAGDILHIHWPAPKPAEALPEDIALDILYEDKYLLVLNKAPGICVHPASGHEEHTIVNALLNHCQGQLSGIGGVARPGIVHRLDLNTSGALIAAKDDTTHYKLTHQFAERTTEKFYLALVCGTTLPTEGRIEIPIKRSKDRKRMTIGEKKDDGRYALTTYKVLARGEYTSLLKVHIHTGRTHQIRIHFKHLGYPVVGDPVYGKRQNISLEKKCGYTAPRQMLHAWKIAFTHPHTQERLHITASPPPDFIEATTRLIGPWQETIE